MEKAKKIILSVVVLIIALIGIFLYVNAKHEATPVNENINADANLTASPTPSPTPTPTPIVGQTYTSDKGKFSFVYPTGKFIPNTLTLSMPFGQRNVMNAEFSVKHEINTEYCALSGKCQPTTVDMSFGAVVIDQTLQTIKSENPNFELTKVKHGNIITEEYAEGAEGEGINYYFIPLSGGKTLMMFERNINEQVVTKYQAVPEFIKFADQQKIMNDIISSLKITQ